MDHKSTPSNNMNAVESSPSTARNKKPMTKEDLEKERNKVINELIDTERKYQQDLQIVIEVIFVDNSKWDREGYIDR